MKLNKQGKISKIYEVIADKTLSFGCEILRTKPNKADIIVDINTYLPWKWVFFTRLWQLNEELNTWDYSIIWCPVMIWDVLDWYNRKYARWGFVSSINRKWTSLWQEREDLRKPIEDQSDECIDFIYSLIEQWAK